MALSPIDIEQKTFRVALRGYAEEEVDQFLDEIVIALRDNERQLRDASERVAVLEEQLEANRETEERIKKTLLIAQRTADDVVQDARRESQQILAEARSQASEIEVERVKERDSLLSDLETLRDRVADIRERLGRLADQTVIDLEAIDTDIASALPERPEEREGGGETPWASDSPEGWGEDASSETSSGQTDEPGQAGGQAFLGSGRRPWERDSD